MRHYRFLATNEHIVEQVHLHWIVLIRVVLETAAAIFGVIAISVVFATHDVGGRFIVTLLTCLALGMAARLLWRLLEWNRTRITITSARLVKSSGIISTKIQTIPLKQITDLSYNLSPNGRLFGYGEFVLETAGDHKYALAKIEYLPRPGRLYVLMCDSIFGDAPRPFLDD